VPGGSKLHVEAWGTAPAGVPAWMFDRARCLDPSRLTAWPFVSMDALSVLSDLLRQALKPPLSSSNAPHSGASRSSHDQNRGEAHDHAKPGTTASDAGRTAKADGDTSKAREIVMFTFRTLQPSRLPMLSVFAVGSAMSSSSQRRPPAIVRPGLRGSRAGVLRRSSSGHQNFAWCLVHGTSSTLRLRFRLGPAPFALASLMNNWSVGPRPLQRKTTVSSSRRARLGLQAIIASIRFFASSAPCLWLWRVLRPSECFLLAVLVRVMKSVALLAAVWIGLNALCVWLVAKNARWDLYAILFALVLAIRVAMMSPALKL
jgi:hypothetical protein